jgi:hypothetical protein
VQALASKLEAVCAVLVPHAQSLPMASHQLMKPASSPASGCQRGAPCSGRRMKPRLQPHMGESGCHSEMKLSRRQMAGCKRAYKCGRRVWKVQSSQYV